MLKSRMYRYRWLGITGIALIPTILLLVLILTHVIPMPFSGKGIIFNS